MNKTCLVTGAKGFIGKALSKRLESSNCQVIGLNSIDGDISEKSTWKNLPKADYVFHLAAKNFVPDSWESPESFLKTNIIGTQLCLDYCKQHQARMFFTSAYLYGAPESLPINEAYPVNPNNPYALSKFLAEQVCTFRSQVDQTAICIFRPFNIYGPGQNSHYLIPSILTQVRNGKEIIVENLLPKRDYLYLDDLVEAMVAVMNSQTDESLFNVGSGISHSVEEVIATIQEVAGSNLPVQSSGVVRKNEIPDVIADISRIQQHTGWQPMTSFRDGIQKIYQQEQI